MQWNVFGNRSLANVGNQVPATQLPVTAANGSFQQPALTGAGVGGANVPPASATMSPIVAAGVLSGAAPFGFLIGRLVGGQFPLDVELNALEQKGLVRSLAQPNLVALSGDTASFLAGGEYPIPVPGSLGQTAIEYKKYGVGLAFTPTVLKDGQINLVIKPKVSQLDPTHGVSIAGGVSVPALTVREASTTVELRDGQSFMLGGLLQNTSQTNQDQLPWLGDVPVLGALFRSAAYQKNETDLVIVVTPHVVRPLRPTDPIHTPLDNTLPGNDVDFFLMGKAEVSPALARLAVGALNRPYVGHILDLPKNGGVYVIGQGLMVRGAAVAATVMLGALLAGCLRHLLRPARYGCARRRRCGGRQSGRADGRSVAAAQQQHESHLQRRAHAAGGRVLSHRQGHPAGRPRSVDRRRH